MISYVDTSENIIYYHGYSYTLRYNKISKISKSGLKISSPTSGEKRWNWATDQILSLILSQPLYDLIKYINVHLQHYSVDIRGKMAAEKFLVPEKNIS